MAFDLDAREPVVPTARWRRCTSTQRWRGFPQELGESIHERQRTRASGSVLAGDRWRSIRVGVQCQSPHPRRRIGSNRFQARAHRSLAGNLAGKEWKVLPWSSGRAHEREPGPAPHRGRTRERRALLPREPSHPKGNVRVVRGCALLRLALGEREDALPRQRERALRRPRCFQVRSSSSHVASPFPDLLIGHRRPGVEPGGNILKSSLGVALSVRDARSMVHARRTTLAAKAVRFAQRSSA
jgi:hypothetical protein